MGDWFGDWIATWLGAVDTGSEGGGGGTSAGCSGGPGTYSMPPGLSWSQKRAYAALMACAPCNQSGGGSGSGSGGGASKIPCCNPVTPANVSWSITGTSGDAGCTSGNEGPIFSDCLLEPDDVNGFYCGPAASVSVVATIDKTCGDTTIRISLCCAEPVDGDPSYPLRYRLGAYLTVLGVGSAQWCTEDIDIGSCDPFYIEMINWVPRYDDFGGAILNLVIT